MNMMDRHSARATIALVDDHPIVRAALAMLIDRESDLVVTGEAWDGSSARTLAPSDVVVLDLVLPDDDGVAIARDLVARRPHTKILGLSMIDEPFRIAAMLRAGARGYALKMQPTHELVDAIRVTASGERYLAPAIRDAVESLAAANTELPLDRLTHREREVFGLLVQGLTNYDVAARLFVAPRTVDTHRQRIMKKLGAHSLLDLIRIAARCGALDSKFTVNHG